MTSLIHCISESLQLDIDYISSIIRRSDYYYKDFSIPKKDGSLRKISQASPELKTLQYWVMKNILFCLPVSASSFAYKSGDSIKRHAFYHKDSRFIFHTDIRKFFPSTKSRLLTIKLEHYKSVLIDSRLWYNDTCDIISKICFRFDGLCIGTVSSPMISNIIMYDFDEYLNAYCSEQGYKYSRYADDIYISSNTYIPYTVKNAVINELSKLNFHANTQKTWFKSKKSQRRIAGLILTDNGRVSVGNNMRCKIKAMIYNRIVHGIGNPDTILGYLAFLKDIEPMIYNRYLIKYASYCGGDVIEAIKTGPKQKLSYFSIIQLPDI
jgi:RNA-directed DNA polymerase